MANYFSWTRDTQDWAAEKHHNPRDITHLIEWVHEINQNPDLPAKLRMDGYLTVDQYTYGLEFLLMDLDRRVRELEKKANGI